MSPKTRATLNVETPAAAQISIGAEGWAWNKWDREAA